MFLVASIIMIGYGILSLFLKGNKMKFIIEHLENEVYEWCLIEYENMSKVVGKENLIFTKTSSSKLKNLVKLKISLFLI